MNSLTRKLYALLPAAAQDLLVTGFSLHLDRQRFGGRYAEFCALLGESQWWDRGRLSDWQDTRLREVVKHAYEFVPYYREAFDRHGVDIGRFRGREDLHLLPLLTRATVKSRLKDLCAHKRSSRRLVEGHTSGTTGSPLTVFYDGDMVAMNYACLYRQYEWAGVRFGRGGDGIAILRGNPIVPLEVKRPPFWRRNYLHNHLLLSGFHLSRSNLPAYQRALQEFRPSVLDAYPSSAYALAMLLSAAGKTIPLKAVLTSSETLYDFQRAAIEKTFACPVFDYFGAAERVIFATECDRHTGRHVCEEYGILEVVDENGEQAPDGEEGLLAGTTLHNLGFPLIRYVTSDRSAVLSAPCSCGRGLRLMQDVSTKSEDLLRLRDGRIISPSALTHPFKPLTSIEASQLVQAEPDRLVVRVVPREEFSTADAEHLVRELKARLGRDMTVTIELLDALPISPNGKFKWVISKVTSGI